MVAYLLPVDHAFAAVTNADGELTIPNLPAGNYEFVVWHEAAGYVHRKYKVTIAAGDNTEEIPYDASKAEL